jgi:hypothetical protein
MVSSLPMAGHAFGTAWVLFAVSFATHFTDEAIHGFLPEYNSRVRMIRNKLPLLPIPTFSFASWLALLITGFVFLLCLSPLAFHNSPWLHLAARPIAVVLGIFNAGLHLVGSIWYRRRVPGFYSAPLLLIASLYLLRTS